MKSWLLCDVYPEDGKWYGSDLGSFRDFGLVGESDSSLGILSMGIQEWDSKETFASIQEALRENNQEVTIFLDTSSFLKRLVSLDTYEKSEILVWNFIEGLNSRNREAYVPGLCEFLGIAYTGSDASAQILSLDKQRMKQEARNLDLRVGRGQVARFPRNRNQWNPKDWESLFSKGEKWFCKPRFEGSGIGIGKESILESPDGFLKYRDYLDREGFVWEGSDFLVEEFLPGREYTTCLLEADSGWVSETAEVLVPSGNVYGKEIKSKSKMPETFICFPEAGLGGFDQDFSEKIKYMNQASVRLAESLEFSGYARIDWKENREGEPCFLEVNLTPGMSPYYSLFPKIWKEARGTNYSTLLNEIGEIAHRNFTVRKKNAYGLWKWNLDGIC
jgi:D-alanine-D-alanine ligase